MFARVFQFEEAGVTAVTAAEAPSRTSRRARNRLRELSGKIGWGVSRWVVGIAFFLPVLWMVITAFKPESAAETWPPKFIFSPTLARVPPGLLRDGART